MARQQTSEAGFTLVEMLLVLSIVSLFCAFPAAFFVKRIGDVTLDQFVEQLQMDIFYIQQLAMSTESVTTIIFSPSQPYYEIKGKRQYQVLEKKTYSSKIRVLAGTLPRAEIKFLPTGNISQIGTMELWYENRKVKIVFQMGKGRFYVLE